MLLTHVKYLQHSQTNISGYHKALLIICLCSLSLIGIAQDTTPPIVTTAPQDSTIECQTSGNPINILSNWYQNHGGMVATDDSGAVTYGATISIDAAVSIFNSSADTLCGNTRSVTVGFFAMDASGNNSNTVFVSFSTVDSQGPTILNEVDNINISCNANLRDSLISWIQNRGGYTANDACTNQVTWTIFNFQITNAMGTVLGQGTGSISNGPYPSLPANVCSYKINISFIVEDDCNNISATPATTFWQVTDNVGPVFSSMPTDTTVRCGYVVNNNINAIDECNMSSITPVYTVSSTQNPDKSLCGHYNYVVTQSWTATDACGNSSLHNRRINFVDNISPAISLRDTVNISCQIFEGNKDSLFVQSIMDLCDTKPIVNIQDISSPIACGRIINRTYTSRDACNNQSSKAQTINVKNDSAPVITKPAKDRMYNCDYTSPVLADLQTWLDSLGGAKADASVCGQLSSFAALPGSYERDDATTYPGLKPSVLSAFKCPSDKDGFLSYVTVDFVFYDECNNVSVSTATFGIGDNKAPVINCGQNIVVNATDTLCGLTVEIPVPIAQDECTPAQSTITRTIVSPLTSDTPGSLSSIVDTIEMSIGPFFASVTSPLSTGKLTVTLRSIDIDDATEFFIIYGEDGSVLGQTPAGVPGFMQCETTTIELSIPLMQLTEWIADGFIDLTFVPNVVPGLPTASINDICANSAITANISYDIDLQNTIRKEYSIDDQESKPLDSLDTLSTYLSVGSHKVTFSYYDCANNKSSCSTLVRVQDVQKPNLICPPHDTVLVNQDSCVTSFKLPLMLSATDNCSFGPTYNKTLPNTPDASLIIFEYVELLDLHMATSKVFEFEGLSKPIATNPDAVITVEFFGDNNDPSEFFEILAISSGLPIGNTNTRNSVDDCGISKSVFNVEGSKFKNLIQNGKVSLIAIPKEGIGGAGLGINSCEKLSKTETTDGVSTLKITLSYGDVTIKAKVDGDLPRSEFVVHPDSTFLTLQLGSGINKVTFKVSDASGNEGTCTTNIVVSDNKLPKAKCKNAVVSIHPSGEIPTFITTGIIDNGSTDNCKIDSIWVDKTQVFCSDAGKDVAVKLYVADDSGNIDSCLASVKVNIDPLQPTYIAGLCTTDTLKFFANVPASNTPGIYSFDWMGPNGNRFFIENPVVSEINTSYNGTYVLTVTGLGDCKSQGTVNVNVQPLTKPSITTQEPTLCENAELVILGTDYVGNVKYAWYEGIFPTGVLISRTDGPQFLTKPAVGVHFYYLIAEGATCSSNASNLLKVTILKQPQAIVNDALLTPCEGDDIVLGTNITNTNFEYFWIGPSYSSNSMIPTVIKDATNDNSGIYKLVIKNGECISDTATTRVEVLGKPPTPQLNANGIYCAGANIQMVASLAPNSDRYEWYKDGTLFTVTQENNLIITDAQPTLEGQWSVRALQGKCFSDLSEPRFIAIELLLEFSASNGGPVCVGDSIQLLATFVPDATYTWDGPSDNDQIPGIPDPKILAVPGDYFVTITTPTACSNNASTTVKVIDLPTITAVSSDAVPCMVIGQTIKLSASVFPNDPLYTYEWSGPDNFNSTLKDATIDDISILDTGQYQLIVKNQGCPSLAYPIDILFDLIPPQPELDAPFFVCSDDTLRLMVKNPIPGITYIWTTPDQGQIISMSDTLEIIKPNNSQAGIYSVTMKNGNCSSTTTKSLFISVRPAPVKPEISGDKEICYGDTILIKSSTAIPGQSYQWVFNGSMLNNNSKDLVIPNTDKSNSGQYSLVTFWNGCSSPSSSFLDIVIKDSITTPSFTDGDLIICRTSQDPIELCLTSSSLIDGSIYNIINGSGLSYVQGDDQCFDINNVSQFSIGTNFVYAQTSFKGCKSQRSVAKIINVVQPPSIQAEIVGGDVAVCPDDFVKVSSKFGPPQVNIKWQSLGSASLTNPNEISTVVNNLETGSNLIALNYSIEGCPDYSKDTVDVFLSFAPMLKQDAYILAYGEKGIYNITLNDEIPTGSTITLKQGPINGSAQIVNGQLIYEGDPRYLSSEIITYEVCPDMCSELCRTTTVVIDFARDVPCRVPNLLTPNGDGFNDLFVIPCLDDNRYPNNRLSVFNEWGQAVFDDKPYGNTWDGTYNGQPCPPGTYFFILTIDSNSKPINGFLIIQR